MSAAGWRLIWDLSSAGLDIYLGYLMFVKVPRLERRLKLAYKIIFGSADRTPKVRNDREPR